MKKLIIACAMLIGIINVAGAETPSPDIVQTTTQVEITSGSSAAYGIPALTVPSNKRLVVQSVSYYVSSPVAGSETNFFVATNIFGNTTFIAGPSVVADGRAYPAYTSPMTFYAGAGAYLTINAYRTGDTTNPEYLYVTIIGYYVARD